MGYRQFRCRGCHKLHRQRVAGQRYCSAQSCQKKRKNAWRREHYATDIDYRLSARDSTRLWLEAQGGASSYYRKYRLRRKLSQPTIIDPNGPQSLKRNKGLSNQQSAPSLQCANSDTKLAQLPVITGRYFLIPPGGANSDAILVQLSVITDEFDDLQRTTGFYCGQNEVKVQACKEDMTDFK